MISVDWNEILSRFAGVPAVLSTLYKLYPTITCEKFLPGKLESLLVLPGSCFAGTKFSHIIASPRQGGMKI